METPKLQTVGGGMSDDEKASLDTFSKLCLEKDLLQRPDGLQENDLVNGLNDEHTLLRYLRGRSCDVDGACRQLRDALTLRQSARAVSAYDTIDVEEFEKTRKLYPHWSGCRDKTGKPIITFDVTLLHDNAIERYNQCRNTPAPECETTVSLARQQALVFNDYLVRFVLPVCTAAKDREDPDVPVSSAVYVVDVSGWTIKQAWGLRAYVQEFTMLLSTCYPEVIQRIYAVNAPPYFSTIWAFLSKCIDARTASKMEIVSPAQVLPTLSAIIELDQIPVQFGGTFDLEHGAPPTIESGIMQSLTVSTLEATRRWPAGPIKLSVGQDGGMAVVAVGTQEGEKRQDVIAVIG